MTWSYSGDPSASELDEVRFLIGDTDTTDQQLSNEEITYLLTQHGSPLAAAINAAIALEAKYSRLADQKTGDIDVKFSQRATRYAELVTQLRTKLGMITGVYAGGISISDREIDETDTDRVSPSFDMGMMDA